MKLVLCLIMLGLIVSLVGCAHHNPKVAVKHSTCESDHYKSDRDFCELDD